MDTQVIPARLACDCCLPDRPVRPDARSRDRRHRLEETRRLLTAAEQVTGSERHDLLDRVVMLNAGLAESIATRYRGRGVDFDDLRQVAYLGLVKAVHGFSTTKSRENNSEFYSYAVPTIRGELQRHFRDTAWTVRLPRRLQEVHQAIAIAEPDLMQTLHRAPTKAELAQQIGADLAEVAAAQTAADAGCFAPLSLDAPITTHSTHAAQELVGDTDTDFDQIERLILLQPLLAKFKDRERRIVELRFVHEWSQDKIAAEIGVSQMQVSRLLRQILNKLRAGLDQPRNQPRNQPRDQPRDQALPAAAA